MPEINNAFKHFGAFLPRGSWPPSEHTTLKNTVKKTPFVTSWIFNFCLSPFAFPRLRHTDVVVNEFHRQSVTVIYEFSGKRHLVL